MKLTFLLCLRKALIACGIAIACLAPEFAKAEDQAEAQYIEEIQKAAEAEAYAAWQARPDRPVIEVRRDDNNAYLKSGVKVNFGSVKLKKNKIQSFSIFSGGKKALIIKKVVIDGKQKNEFKVTSFDYYPENSGVVHRPASKLKNFVVKDDSGAPYVFVSFKPTALKTCNATMHVYTNDPKTPVFHIKLTGKGKK